MANDGKDIWIDTQFGKDTKEPYVSLHYQDIVIQMIPEDARTLALNLLMACEASEQDAFIHDFGMECGKGDKNAGSNILAFYRKWREEKNRK